MDEVLKRALEPVLRDLGTADIPPPRFGGDWAEDANTPSVMLWSADGSGAGVLVVKSDAMSEQVASVADQVQQWAIEDLFGRHLPPNWPPCPAHPDTHPLTATNLRSTALWVCPIDSSVVRAIGSLPGTN